MSSLVESRLPTSLNILLLINSPDELPCTLWQIPALKGVLLRDELNSTIIHTIRAIHDGFSSISKNVAE